MSEIRQKAKKAGCQEGKKLKTQLIITSFLFHRRSSTFLHLHNTNKRAAAYLHSCSLKRTHSFSLAHIADMCIWATNTPVPHSVFHVFSCGFFLNISPANYYFMHYPNVSLLVRETEGREKKNVGFGDGEIQNVRRRKGKEGQEEVLL